MAFVIYSRKTGKYLNQSFLQDLSRNRVDEIVFVKLVIQLCFFVKISKILQKVMVFFPERGEETKTSF